jgi:quercetin dioxygenase-like cupin family protein
LYILRQEARNLMAIKVLHVDRDYVEIPGALEAGSMARAVVWPGMGASRGVMHYVRYEKGGHVSVRHQHPYSEDIAYVIEGEGYVIEWENDEELSRHALGPGSVMFVEPGTMHSQIATTPLTLVGGPSPPDLEFYKQLGLKW